MNIYLYDDDRILTFSLPYKKIGNFWMTDLQNKNLVNISGENGNWIISGSENTSVFSNETNEDGIVLKPNNFYTVRKNDKDYILFADAANDNTFEPYLFNDNSSIKVGKSADCNIIVNIQYINDLQFTLTSENGIWKIQKTEGSNIYLNEEIIKNELTNLSNGDVIDLYGFKMVIAKSMILINNSLNAVTINGLARAELVVNDEIDQSEIIDEPMYKDDDYFMKSPRMRKVIVPFEMRIDSPPSKEAVTETPLIMTIGPMLTMAASSMVTLSNTISAVVDGTKTWKQSIPSLVICISMICSMLVWPFITRRYEKKRKKKKEEERQTKYKAYLETKKEALYNEYDFQKRALEESLLATNVCYDVIINKRRTLWERKLDQGDFLNLRVGKGEVPFNSNISYSSEDFKMDDDNLKKMLETLIQGFKIINDVPVGFSFAENNKVAINGIYPKYIDFMNNLILQMMAYYSYDDLKLVVFTNKKNQNRWKYLKKSPYIFSDDKSMRYFATSTEEMQEISNYLDQLFNNRKELNNNGNSSERITDYSKFKGYYLLIVDDIDLARKINLVDDILDYKGNLGFGVIVIEEKLSKLPSEVTHFITVGENASVIVNTANSDQIRFNDEVNKDFDMNLCAKTLSNLPLYMDTSIKQLPNTITFLELFSVGKIEQLNVLNRWKENDPVKTLKTEVGVNENGDGFVLDLHEKQHGPHGLVAGMTGSGKSEFIITYILSMAVNYSPEEVAFVLIDYKGGGLAGAFVNSETGKKLPHVVGTITNLDKSEINRALSSINSELRRRQTKFNEVRDKIGESTIDIYKYQKLYREGVIDEPIPHLIIVSDEFAELKDQQPEFMDDLISTARIGRSLGVHLILATQKPSGVVDGQIWSNSKFKVCLKVQDKSDSMEMIKNDLAAELKNVGRFYLQVGYNEYFALGQSAWAGAQYYPSKEFKKAVDKNVYFINNVGSVDKVITNSTAKKSMKSEGEELTNIVKYLIDIGNDSDLKINQLWLDRIPNEIYIPNLLKKYNYAKEKYIINPLIGEYDNPSNQMQGLLTLPISNEGNVLVYGTSDSGKDEFLSSLVYSMLMTYDTSELNLYMLDFGAETLMNYADAPQVGNVILNGDTEKLENLVKMLTSEMNNRKKLFMSYNGNYIDYIKMSKNPIPNIVVIINSIEVLSEMYMDYVDEIAPIVREGNKYGIHFVITTTSQSTIKFKIAQTCKQLICLQMNNEAEYRDILGKTGGIVPFNCLGRGLVRIDGVCEFQTAFISPLDKTFDSIKNLVNTLNQKGIDKARGIPVMPDIIKLDIFNEKYLGVNSVPVGLAKDSLTQSLYDYTKQAINIIGCNDLENARGFINNYLKALESNKSFGKIVIDGNNYFEEFNYNINLINSDFNKTIDQLKSVDDQVEEELNKNNRNLRSIKNIGSSLCVIINFDKFYNKLDDEHKNIFKTILEHNRETLKILFVFIDVPGSFKKYEYEEWFKNNVDTNDGLWLGGGVTQQYLIKLLVQPSGLSNISDEYGVVVRNGMPTVIKLLNEIKINVK